MQAKSTDRHCPGVGAASLKHFQDKFHKDMLRSAKSRLGNQFNDRNIKKYRDELKVFKKEQGLDELRQIDKSNLKMFVRLSSVQPSVPMVVKRSVVQYVELQPIPDSEDYNGEPASPLLQSYDKRSVSVPRTQQKFKLNVQQTMKPLASPREVYRSTSNVNSETVANQQLMNSEPQSKTVKHHAIQSMTQLPKSLNLMESNPALQPLKADSSACTVKTTTQWYLKSPSKHSFYDESYKVVPSLNHAQRVRKLNQITKDNLKMFERLQGVRSDYDATKLLNQTNRQLSHKRRLAQFQNGLRKPDPLENKHKMATSLSRKRLSSLQSLNRTRGAESSIESHPSPSANEASSTRRLKLNQNDGEPTGRHFDSERPSKNKTTMVMSRTAYPEHNLHHLPGIGKQTHREKQLAAINKRHQEREYKMPQGKKHGQQHKLLIEQQQQEQHESRAVTQEPEETPVLDMAEQAAEANQVAQEEVLDRTCTNDSKHARQLTLPMDVLEESLTAQEGQSEAASQHVKSEKVSTSVNEGAQLETGQNEYSNSYAQQERLRQTYNSRSKIPGASQKRGKTDAGQHHDNKPSAASSKRLVPILRNRNITGSPMKSHEPAQSPRTAEQQQAVEDNANLPELNKTLISYKTSKVQTGRRPWLDPDYIKVGRSVRIAGSTSRDNEQASAQNVPSATNSGSIDRAQKLYNAINLKEAAKRGGGSKNPSFMESGQARVMDQPDFTLVGGAPNATASENIQSEDQGLMHQAQRSPTQQRASDGATAKHMNGGSTREATFSKSSQFSQYEQSVAPKKKKGSKSGAVTIKKSNVAGQELVRSQAEEEVYIKVQVQDMPVKKQDSQ